MSLPAAGALRNKNGCQGTSRDFFQSVSIQTLCMRFVSLLDPSSGADFMGHHRLFAIGKALLK